jgi:glycolate oxidase iron-sulfur subunit
MLRDVSTTEPSAAPASPVSWFDAEDPPGRRDINTCIHCGLCLTACPTYRELKIEPDSPRGRIYLMRGLAEGRIAPSDPLVEHLDNCLGCRACETVCPAGVPYGRMLEETRGQLTRREHRGDARPGLLRALGELALRSIIPDRDRMNMAADLLRLGQNRAIASLMQSALAQRLLPAPLRQGYAMTPPIAPRHERALQTIATRLPAGARMEERDHGLIFHPAATPKVTVGFFTSCVMDVMFPRVNQEAVRLLVLAGCRVEVPRAQTCCGALHAHSGLRHEARQLAAKNAIAFASKDLDWIVNDSAGCGAALHEAGHLLGDHGDRAAAESLAARARDLSEVLHQIGLPETTVRLRSPRFRRPLRVAYHDPCHLAHGQGVRSAPRELLRRLPGIEVMDLPNADWCCGSAGVYNLTHPAMADAQLARKLDSIAKVSPDFVVASNPGCLLHMGRGARARGLGARMVHLVDVLAMAWPAPGDPPQPPEHPRQRAVAEGEAADG